MIFSIIAAGQELRHQLEEVEVTPPKFVGVENAVTVFNQAEEQSITQHLANQFEYPDEWNLLYTGTEVIKFTVTTEGELTNFKVINSIGHEVDEEIIQLLEETNGMWRPGHSNGKPVAMEKEVAMEIRTGETEGSALRKDFKLAAEHSFKKGSSAFLEKGKAKKALRHYDRGIQYAPYEKSLLLMRGLCRYELGNTNGAREDWIRLKELGGIEMVSSYIAEIKHLKGYQELAFMFLNE